ncbi:MAG: hypothetical protein K6C34_05815 [Alphaproteobacteria bacterium]|nr:hypothetical protein [Alphaproteobacteria bacterium]
MKKVIFLSALAVSVTFSADGMQFGKQWLKTSEKNSVRVTDVRREQTQDENSARPKPAKKRARLITADSEERDTDDEMERVLAASIETDEIRQMRAALDEKDEALAKMESELIARDQVLEKMGSELQSKISALTELNGNLREKDESLQRATSALKDKERSLASLSADLQAKSQETDELRSALDDAIAKQDTVGEMFVRNGVEQAVSDLLISLPSNRAETLESLVGALRFMSCAEIVRCKETIEDSLAEPQTPRRRKATQAQVQQIKELETLVGSLLEAASNRFEQLRAKGASVHEEMVSAEILRQEFLEIDKLINAPYSLDATSVDAEKPDQVVDFRTLGQSVRFLLDQIAKLEQEKGNCAGMNQDLAIALATLVGGKELDEGKRNKISAMAIFERYSLMRDLLKDLQDSLKSRERNDGAKQDD